MTVNYIFDPENYATGGSGRTGFTMYMTPTTAGSNALGVWAVTAPTSITSHSITPSSDSGSSDTAGR
jgi:hypothetical protein